MKLISGNQIEEAFHRWQNATGRPEDVIGFREYLGADIPVGIELTNRFGGIRWLVDDEAAERITLIYDSPHWKTLIKAHYAKHGSE